MAACLAWPLSLCVGRVAPAQITLSPSASPARDWIARLASSDFAVRHAALVHMADFLRPTSLWSEAVRQYVVRETSNATVSDPSVLLAAIDALRVDGSPEALVALRGLVETRPRFAEVSAAAAMAVAYTGAPWAAQVLLASPMAATLPSLRESLARALARLPESAFGVAVQQSSAQTPRLALMLRAIAYRGDARWGLLVQRALGMASIEVRRAAVFAAARLGLVDLAQELTDTARDAPDRTLRVDALAALAHVGGPTDPGVLAAALEEPFARSAALGTIGQLGDEQYVDLVGRLLAAPWSVDRRDALRALGQIGGPLAVRRLRFHLAAEPDASTRLAAFRALYDAAPSLATTLARERTRTDPAATALLQETAMRARGDRVDAPPETARALGVRLASATDESLRTTLAFALSRLRDDAATAVLRAVWQREFEAPSRAGLVVAWALGQRADRESVCGFRRAAESGPRAMRLVAFDALARIGDVGAAGLLEAAARTGTDGSLRGAALVALSRVAPDRARGVAARVRPLVFTAEMDALVGEAERIASGLVPRDAESPTGVVRVDGAEPDSVWISLRDDASVALGVADASGVVWIGRVVEDGAAVEPVSVP